MESRTPRFSLKRLLIATGVVAGLLGGCIWVGDRVRDRLRESQLSAVRNAYDYDGMTREEARNYVGDVVDSWPEPKKP